MDFLGYDIGFNAYLILRVFEYFYMEREKYKCLIFQKT